MPFSVTPKSGPTINTPPKSSARDRAITKFMGGEQQQSQAPAAPVVNQSQEHPVSNPTQVSPEDMGAIAPAAAALKAPEPAKTDGQKSSSEGSEEKPSQEATEKKEDPLSSHYAILARKEKALRAKAQAQESAIKAREDALKAKEEALAAKESEQSRSSKFISVDQLMQDPLSVLSEHGLTYEQLTALAMNNPTQQSEAGFNIQKLREQIKAELQEELKPLKEAQEKAKQDYETHQQQSYQQALNQIRNEAQNLVNSNEAFETIKETGSVNDVVELIEQTFKEDGILLTVEEAAKQVEDYLVEEAMKIARIKKIQSRLAPAPQAPKAAEAPKSEAPKQQPMRTLTNANSTSPRLSARERAIAAFEGKLNK